MSEHKHKYILQCFHTNIYVLKYILFVQLTMIFFVCVNFTKVFTTIYWTDLMSNEDVLTHSLSLHKQWNNVNLEIQGLYGLRRWH